MQSRITFLVYGDQFDAQKCMGELLSNDLVAEFDVEYSTTLSFTHPDEFSEYWDEAYEKKYFDFIAKNIGILQFNGATDFTLFTEMYIEPNEQCNFEILGPDFYQYIGKYNIGLPVSVYVVELEPQPQK